MILYTYLTSSHISFIYKPKLSLISLSLSLSVYLPVRILDPTKIIVTGKRVRFSSCCISDITQFDPNAANPLALVNMHQQVNRLVYIVYLSSRLTICLACAAGRSDRTGTSSISAGLSLSAVRAARQCAVQHRHGNQKLLHRST